MFSARSGFDRTPNRLSRVLERLRRESVPVIDLTESNPTRCDFQHPGPAALEALAHPAGLAYRPEPKGLPDARAAVARYYAERGVAMDPERILLTASTSEAYALLFKLLADPGREILTPRPSYPLLEFLTGLEGLSLGSYALDQATGWAIDFGSLAAAVNSQSAAVVIVSPNNPTGSWPETAELARLDELAAEHGLAVIADEVFADFSHAGGEPPVSAAAARHALSFSLGGLSKSCGLPQLKLAWVAVGGPRDLAGEAMGRLELIADSYLSVATPVQLALSKLLAGRHAFREECLARLRHNLGELDRQLAGRSACERLSSRAGWYACVRVPRLDSEEDLVLGLVDEDHVLVHPGYFYDFPGEAYVVLSLIVRPAEFATGLERLLSRLGGA